MQFYWGSLRVRDHKIHTFTTERPRRWPGEETCNCIGAIRGYEVLEMSAPEMRGHPFGPAGSASRRRSSELQRLPSQFNEPDQHNTMSNESNADTNEYANEYANDPVPDPKPNKEVGLAETASSRGVPVSPYRTCISDRTPIDC